MTATNGLRVAIFLGVLLIVASATPAFAQPDAWGVSYPEIRISAPEGDIPLGVSVSPNGGGLALGLTWSDGRPARGLPKSIADPAKILIRLHVGDETVVAPPGPPVWVGISKSGYDSYFLISVFPWQRNALDEAWFQVTAGGVTHWIEIPYGLARNPFDPQADGVLRGYPRLPKAMANLDDRNTIVPWLHAEYQIGEIHDGARLWLQLIHSNRQRIVTMIHRDMPDRGHYAWTMERPIVSATIELSRGRSFPGLPSARKLHTDGVRDDEFTFTGDGSPEREWGTIAVRVDDRAYSVRVPSSLFKRLHGLTNPGNARRISIPFY
jgi:hypothetical protein